MKKRVQENIIKLAYHAVLFASLLLLSAVAEHGETEMSKVLVPRMSDVPGMIEALVAAMTVSVAGGALSHYIVSKDR